MNNNTKASQSKIFKDAALGVGTFLGGPLVAGYFIAENFKALGQPERVKHTWLITILLSIVIFTIIFLIPEDSKIPDQLYPAVYTAIAYGFYHKYQKQAIDSHLNSGGLAYDWGRVILAGIIGLLITLGIIFGVIFLTEDIQNTNNTVAKYGLNGQDEITYSNQNIDKLEIDEIAEGFRYFGFYDDSFPQYLHVEKKDNTYEIYFAVEEEFIEDPSTIAYYEALHHQMSGYLTNNSVKFMLVVDYLDNVVKVVE